MAPLDPWIIEEIKKRERRQEDERRREQPTVPADDPREIPDRRDEDGRNPGYEMPNSNEPARAPAEKKDDVERGVYQIDIGGADDENRIDISKIPGQDSEKKEEKRPD